MDLLEALEAARKDAALVPQVQGDCGVFAFWYATVLLRYCGDKRPPIYPRKHPRPGVEWKDKAHPEHSVREWAKKHLFSGQGEILTTTEMKAMVACHGYQPIVARDGPAITFLVHANRPVLICYSIREGLPDPNPKGPHAHWSLIVASKASFCQVLNPHDPGIDHTWPLQTLLASNRAVDSYAFERYWYKLKKIPLVSETTLRAWLQLENDAPIPRGAYETRYDIGQNNRSQALRGAILGVA
jgi:hypothetical protein